MTKTMIIRPRMSEKAYGQSQTGTYVFEVPAGANKQSIATAVEQQFEVTVTAVNIANVKGKVKRSIRRGGRAVMGRRNDTKKAYVSLKEGDSIPVFAAVETEAGETKPAKKEEK